MEGAIAVRQGQREKFSPRRKPRRRPIAQNRPRPGYLAIELANLGPYRITELDISHSFARIATENAARAGVFVDFKQGDAAALPLAASTIYFIICRAAFKNFSDPLGTLREIHRVLRPEGTALIIDMRNDVSDKEISSQVKKLRVNAFVTKIIFKHMLRKRAYSGADFARMRRRRHSAAARSPKSRSDSRSGWPSDCAQRARRPESMIAKSCRLAWQDHAAKQLAYAVPPELAVVQSADGMGQEIPVMPWPWPFPEPDAPDGRFPLRLLPA